MYAKSFLIGYMQCIIFLSIAMEQTVPALIEGCRVAVVTLKAETFCYKHPRFIPQSLLEQLYKEIAILSLCTQKINSRLFTHCVSCFEGLADVLKQMDTAEQKKVIEKLLADKIAILNASNRKIAS